jgi:hypothetical protein
MSRFDPWNYRPDAGWTAEQEIVGYHVEATDGGIGKVAATSHAMDESYVVVDTGPWIFGRKVLLPAGTVTRIDHEDRTVYLDQTKEQIKSSPDYDPDMWGEPGYRDKIGGHYSHSYDSSYGGGFQGFAPGGGPAR